MGLLKMASRTIPGAKAVRMRSMRMPYSTTLRRYETYDPKKVDSEYVSPRNGAPRYFSPWNKWFPYEPVPCSPQLKPYKVHLNGGETYWWCACGECTTQPFSEPEPDGCRSRGFAPMLVDARYSGVHKLCGCKHCATRPASDHAELGCYMVWVDQNPLQAAVVGFSACFVLSLVLTWLGHP